MKAEVMPRQFDQVSYHWETSKPRFIPDKLWNRYVHWFVKRVIVLTATSDGQVVAELRFKPSPSEPQKEQENVENPTI